MANFDLAVTPLLIDEGNGKIANDPNDPGGLTRWGISKRSYPNLDIANLSRADAIAIYHDDWWPEKYNQISSQAIADKLLSFSVVMGQHAANIALQRACRAASGSLLLLDGILGSKTLEAVNKSNPIALLAALRSEGAAQFRSINNPSEQEGWQNRAYE